MGIIHHVRSYFQKPIVGIHLEAYIRTIVVLIGGKRTVIYFLYLLSTIYFSVTTHLQQGKKVSVIPPGDLNHRHVPSRLGLLEDSPYHVLGVACPLYDESRLCT
jgi:hypothetical protein